MNASHTATAGPINLHPAGTRRVQRTVLLALYAALAAQLAIWSTLAARVGLTAALTQAHQGAEADVVVGGAVWLVQFTLAVVLATIRYRRYHR
jgi:sterol desaturase/sphingolipid hydroxylase (fatty acid hydroxylase superfamily)